MKNPQLIKISILLYTILLFVLNNNAQGFKGLDKIPHDIEYCKEFKLSTPLIKVLYGRPSVNNNEKVFGNKIPYGKVWRTGANEATEIKLYKDVMFGNKLVSAGTYVLITIPGEKEWEIILNKNTDVWGAYLYNPEANVASVKVAVSKAEKIEIFSISFKTSNQNAFMILGWGITRVEIPFSYSDPTPLYTSL